MKIKDKKYYKDIDIEKIKSLYLNERLSISKVANYFNISGNVIKRKLVQSGIEIRKRYSNKNYKINQSVFETIDTEEKAYWLGMLFADGSICNYKYGKSVQLELIDKEHIEKFKIFLNFTGDVTNKNNYSFNLRTCDYKICTDLVELGCIPNKTYNLSYLPILPKELQRHFIRGYFDGDGCLFVKNTKERFLAGISFYGHKYILESIINIFQRDLQIHINTFQGKKYKDPITSFLIGGNKNIHKVLKYLYRDSNVNLNRKLEKARLFYEIQLTRPKNILLKEDIPNTIYQFTFNSTSY